MLSLVTQRSQSEGIFRKIDVFNILQRNIPGFEDVSVNIFLMCKYVQKDVLDPVLFMCYY